ncbi:MAG TPA: hypothetical protein VL172_11350 [Kofleriaceae bacterium]|nr:hypothetical protein [Kofleriaceae bacterium]
MQRFLTCAGFEPIPIEDPAQAQASLDGCSLFVCDSFDGDQLVTAVRANPNLRGILITAEPLKPALRHMVEYPQISNILGRANFESAPRRWETMMVLRRVLRPAEPGPPFASFLDWGFNGFQEKVGSTQHRDALVQKVERFITHLGVPKRVGEMFAELTHEMLMNAMYDAPVDAAGKPKFALDRKASITLAENEQPTVRLACDGTRLAIQVVDPYGRLERKHVFGGLSRGLIEGGEMDKSHGGAGLGMVVCHNSTVAMFFDVVRGKKTEVTGVFDLDMNLREFRTHAKSLHFFSA